MCVAIYRPTVERGGLRFGCRSLARIALPPIRANALDAGHAATYEPSRRSYKWLKVKKDYLDGVGDSLDLVVMGGFQGKGKRTGVYGAYLVGCRDDNEGFQSIAKVGTGFSDENLAALTAAMDPHAVEIKPSYYSSNMEPDVWFSANAVWEVRLFSFFFFFCL